MTRHAAPSTSRSTTRPSSTPATAAAPTCPPRRRRTTLKTTYATRRPYGDVLHRRLDTLRPRAGNDYCTGDQAHQRFQHQHGLHRARPGRHAVERARQPRRRRVHRRTSGRSTRRAYLTRAAWQRGEHLTPTALRAHKLPPWVERVHDPHERGEATTSCRSARTTRRQPAGLRPLGQHRRPQPLLDAGRVRTPVRHPERHRVWLLGNGKLPIYVNAGSHTTPSSTSPASLPSAAEPQAACWSSTTSATSAAARVDMQVGPPPEHRTHVLETARSSATTPATVTSANCTITGMTSGNYNGRLVTASIPIPPAYGCDFVQPLGCWSRSR